MKDIFGDLLLFIVSLVIGAIIGVGMAHNTITNDCNTLHKFRRDNVVYTCVKEQP
jgi:hypothetical protein